VSTEIRRALRYCMCIIKKKMQSVWTDDSLGRGDVREKKGLKWEGKLSANPKKKKGKSFRFWKKTFLGEGEFRGGVGREKISTVVGMGESNHVFGKRRVTCK